jgi:hypothetical protein
MAIPEHQREMTSAARRDMPTKKGSLAGLEADGTDLLSSTTMEERMVMMWQLAQDAWAFRGEPIGESRLSRHPGRFVRRGS